MFTAFEIKRKDIIFFVVFVVLWLIPCFLKGFIAKPLPGVPRIVSYFHSLSNLFTHAVLIWPMPYIQIYDEDHEIWITLNERQFFQMETFGYRTRLFEAVYYATSIPDYNRKSLGVRQEMAEWIIRRYGELYPERVRPAKVRFVAGLYRVHPHVRPEGRWRNPPFEMFGNGQWYVISEHEIKS